MTTKKMFVWIVVLLMVLQVFTGCKKSEDRDSTMAYDQEYATTAAGTVLYDAQFSESMAKDGNGDYSELPVGTSGESYTPIVENKYVQTGDEAVSTFSIDVDTASYSNVRNMLSYGMMPEPDAVRIEELINYFDYDYAQPEPGVPFSITSKLADCPWNPDHHLMMVGLQGIEVPKSELPSSNIVMLIDVSGSMSDENKLPLLKKAFERLIGNLDSRDRVSLVVYAGAAGVVLEGSDGNDEDKILEALNELESGGSTAGGEGIELAYNIAEKYFIEDGNNRVVLATDGDFNVGMSDVAELEEFISEKRETGIYLTVLGFGRGNIQDNIMETLADSGNGNYAYIDTLEEANKVFSEQLTGTLFAIAKDVKIQVEFNADMVSQYRLIGYENRVMNNEDFEDDTKDAGELGVGHTVTALYEITPVTGIDLKEAEDGVSTIRLRYKEIDSDVSQEIVEAVNGSNFIDGFDIDLEWASLIAEFGMILRKSEFMGDASIEDVMNRAERCLQNDRDPYKQGFLELIEDYQEIIG